MIHLKTGNLKLSYVGLPHYANTILLDNEGKILAASHTLDKSLALMFWFTSDLVNIPIEKLITRHFERKHYNVFSVIYEDMFEPKLLSIYDVIVKGNIAVANAYLRFREIVPNKEYIKFVCNYQEYMIKEIKKEFKMLDLKIDYDLKTEELE